SAPVISTRQPSALGRAGSSRGSYRACRSTATEPRASGATSATQPSCSRPTTGSASSRGCRFGLSIRSTRVPPVTSTELQAEDIRWDLTDLCSDAEEARTQWTALVARAQELASRYRGKTASLDAVELRALLDHADALHQVLPRLQVYSYLRLSMAATDVEANDLTTFSRDRAAEIENALVFL